MSTVAPTGGQTALGTPPVATPSAIVVEPNEAAQVALAGNIVTGTVIGRDARGAVQLRTQNGVMLLQTNARLPVGAIVTLQVQAVGAQLQAVLLQVVASNGRPLTVGIDPAFPQAPTLGVPPTAAPQPAPVTVGEGPTVTAIVVGTPRSGTPQPPPAPAGKPPADAPPRGSRAAATPSATPAPAAPASPARQAGAPASGMPAPGATPSAVAPAAPPATPLAGVAGMAAPRGAIPVPPGAISASPAAIPPQGAAAQPAAQASAIAPGAAPAVQGQALPLSSDATQAQPGREPTVTTLILPQAAQLPAGTAAGTRTAPATPSVPSPGAPIAAGGAVLAAVIQSESTPPAASLAYAATQVATTHVMPPRATALVAQALAETIPGAPTTHAGAPAGPLPPGSTLEVRVAVTAEAATQPAAAGRSQLLATIVGRTPTGQGIVDTVAGRLAVPLPSAFATAPVGTRLTLDVVAWRAALALRAPVTHLALETDAVRPVADTVADIARASHGRVDPHDVLPRPGPRLAQQLADAAAAISTGKVAEWLGKPAVEALERRGQGELVRRLEHDLYEAARAAPQTSDWRSLILPFVVGDLLRPLRLYVRQRHERARDKQQGTRFVLECDHDELGALQLDGLVHAKRIDVILRTHAQMPESMRTDLTALFGDACGVMGYSGQLEFQAVPAFPAVPRAEPTPHHVGVVA